MFEFRKKNPEPSGVCDDSLAHASLLLGPAVANKVSHMVHESLVSNIKLYPLN